MWVRVIRSNIILKSMIKLGCKTKLKLNEFQGMRHAWDDAL